MSIPNSMLISTATLAASTPAAPLMPQNHGVGLSSTPRDKPRSGRKAEAHEEANRRQDQNSQSGSDQHACTFETEQDVRKKGREGEKIQANERRPADELRATVERDALGRQAAKTR